MTRLSESAPVAAALRRERSMILVLRALGVGDLATAVPALRGLRAAFPDRILALAAPGWLAPLAGLVGGIDHLVPVEGLESLDAGDPGFAGVKWGRGAGLPAPFLAMNLHGRGPQSHRLLQAARPERLAAFACPAASHPDGPRWEADEHEVRRWCRLLSWYGIPADPADLSLRRPSPDRVPVGVTIVHPGAKEADKRWAPGRFAAVARQLSRSGHRVVITGSAAERDLAERVASQAGLPGTAVLAGRVDLAGLAALVAYGRLVVSADTGIAHLATAYTTPSVVLFGPVSPDLWGPPPDRCWHRVLRGAVTAGLAAHPDGWASPTSATGGDSGYPSATGGDSRGPVLAGDAAMHSALAAISVDDVLAAAGEVDQLPRVSFAGTVSGSSRPRTANSAAAAQ